MRIRAFASAAALVLLGAVSFAQSTNYDYDRSTDFARFRTYAWVHGTELADEINHNRIVSAIAAQLAVKGLTRVPVTERPDVLVAYHAAFDRDIQVTGFSSGWGPYRFGNLSGIARADEILTGTLAVDVVDVSTGTIVWRGTAVKEIDVKADPVKRERNINRAVERLFKNYPPKK